MNRSAVLFLALLAGALCASPSAWAQQAAKRLVVPERSEPVLYQFKNLDGQSAGAVCGLAGNLFRVQVNYSPLLRTATISPIGIPASDWRDRTLDFLAKYDVPPPSEPQVRYVAYLIRASNAKTENAPPQMNPIPKELNEAIAEMKSSLVYAHYDLLTTVTSVSQGGASASDMIPVSAWNEMRLYDLEFSNVAVAQDRKSVAIHPFQFRLRSPSGDKGIVLASISSNITIHEGQKLVLGKVRLSDNSDIFVVLTVKVE